MMNLAEYRRRSQSLADFLPWAALVERGVILNKDGSFQRTARFRGPDLDSAPPAELVAITSRLNNALRRLGSGWAVFIEAQRVPAHRYPVGEFPDPVSALVDAERRAQFEEEGAHFESGYFLTLLWLPPADDAARAEAIGLVAEVFPDAALRTQALARAEAWEAERHEAAQDRQPYKQRQENAAARRPRRMFHRSTGRFERFRCCWGWGLVRLTPPQ